VTFLLQLQLYTTIEFVLNKVLLLYPSIPYQSPSFCLDSKVTKADSVESAAFGYVQPELARSPRLNRRVPTAETYVGGITD